MAQFGSMSIVLLLECHEHLVLFLSHFKHGKTMLAYLAAAIAFELALACRKALKRSRTVTVQVAREGSWPALLPACGCNEMAGSLLFRTVFPDGKF